MSSGYVIEIDNDGLSGVIQEHGTNGGTYSFYNYSGDMKLRVQARVSFTAGDPHAWLADGIVWDGVTYDVPANQVAEYQTQLYPLGIPGDGDRRFRAIVIAIPG